MCVCLICKDVKLRFWFFTSYAGGHSSIHQSVANEATGVWRGYAVWSTARTCFFRHSKGPSSEPQTLWFYFFTVATICIFAEIMSPMHLWLFWESIAETSLFFGISACWSNVVDSGLNSIWQHWMLYIVFVKYLKGLYCKSNDLAWFARFRIQFLPDHIMILSNLVCACMFHVDVGLRWFFG